MSQRADEIKAGFMVLAGAFLLGMFYLEVTGVDLWKIFDGFRGKEPDTVGHVALVSFSAGLKKGSAVRFGGHKVGEVLEVIVLPDLETLSEPETEQERKRDEELRKLIAVAEDAWREGSAQKRIAIKFEVPKTLPVSSDSEVKIAQFSMLGDFHLEVTTGTPAGTPLTSPKTFVGHEPVDLFETMGNLAGQMEPILASVNKILTDDVATLRLRMQAVFDRIESILKSVDEGLLGVENRENVAATLAQLRGVLDDNRDNLRVTVENVRDMSVSLKATMLEVQKLLGEAPAAGERGTVAEILAELDATIIKAEALMENMDGMVTENRPGLADMVHNLNATAANARDFTETLAEEPWRLMWPAKEQADAALKEAR